MLDTNVLLLAARRRFPFESEIARLVPGARLVVPSSALRELDGLAARRTAGAVVARDLAARFPVATTSRRGDEGVIDAADRSRALVATADRALQRRLIDRGVGVLVPRDRGRLELRPPAPRQRLRNAPRSMRRKAA